MAGEGRPERHGGCRASRWMEDGGPGRKAKHFNSKEGRGSGNRENSDLNIGRKE